MDSFTQEHFEKWIERTIPRDDMENVRGAILDLLANDPELLDGRSWPELREMAENGKS